MNNSFSTKSITFMAIFVAIFLALRAVPVPPFMGGFFSFSALPIILSGFILGPKYGFWVGAVSDILECMLFPRGPYFPGFTITQALTGCLPALVAGSRKFSFLWILMGVACGQVVTKLILVPSFLQLTLTHEANFVDGWSYYATIALVTQSFHIPLYSWLSYLILRSLQQVDSLKTWHEEQIQGHSSNDN